MALEVGKGLSQIFNSNLPRSDIYEICATTLESYMAAKVRTLENGDSSSVQVAVRVRPFSQRCVSPQRWQLTVLLAYALFIQICRELVMGASCVIAMVGNTTSITSSTGKVHLFSYDHCFWSMEGGAAGKGGGAGNGGQREIGGAGQREVYNALAGPLLNSSFNGYNICLFSYGQTGSGKSYR